MTPEVGGGGEEELIIKVHNIYPEGSRFPLKYIPLQLVREVEEEQPVGCMILDKVYKASASGVEGVGRALKQARE